MRKNKNPLNDDVIDRFLDYLHFKEMSSKKDPDSLRHFNNSGYVGAFQMGNMALQDAGLMNIGELIGKTRKERTMNADNWVGGADARDAFLSDYGQQRAAARALAERNHKSLQSTFKKQGITDEHEIASYLAGAHLLGARGVREHMTGKTTKGYKAARTEDAHGTTIEDYRTGYNKWAGITTKEPLPPVPVVPEGHITNPAPVSNYNMVEPAPLTAPTGPIQGPLKEDNTYAMGGSLGLNAYGSDINMFHAGGSHEENPAGGVVIGMGANGQPNTVQEHEAMYKLDLGNGEKEKVIYANKDNISYES